jgi:hypothetical protein
MKSFGHTKRMQVKIEYRNDFEDMIKNTILSI